MPLDAEGVAQAGDQFIEFRRDFVTLGIVLRLVGDLA